MVQKQITAANANEQIKQLYETAFPKDEQIPWEDLLRLIGEMHLDFTAYYEGNDFIKSIINEKINRKTCVKNGFFRIPIFSNLVKTRSTICMY